MFYSHTLLCRRTGGRYSVVWFAATHKKVSLADTRKVNIEQTCEGLIQIIQTENEDEHQRFSLYLSSMLMYGTCLVHSRQVCLFLEELMEWKKMLYKSLTDELTLTLGQKHIKGDRRPEEEDGAEKQKRRKRPKKIRRPESSIEAEVHHLHVLPLLPEVPDTLPQSAFMVHDASAITLPQELPSIPDIQQVSSVLEQADQQFFELIMEDITAEDALRDIPSVSASVPVQQIGAQIVEETVKQTEVPVGLQVQEKTVKEKEKEISLPQVTKEIVTAEKEVTAPKPSEGEKVVGVSLEVEEEIIQPEAERQEPIEPSAGSPSTGKQKRKRRVSIEIESSEAGRGPHLPGHKKKRTLFHRVTGFEHQVIKDRMENFRSTMRASLPEEEHIEVEDINVLLDGESLIRTPGYPLLHEALYQLFRKGCIVKKTAEWDLEYSMTKIRDEVSDLAMVGDETSSLQITAGSTSPFAARMPGVGQPLLPVEEGAFEQQQSEIAEEMGVCKQQEALHSEQPIEVSRPHDAEPEQPPQEDLQTSMKAVPSLEKEPVPVLGEQATLAELEELSQEAHVDVAEQPLAPQKEGTPERSPRWVLDVEKLLQELESLWRENGDVTTFQLLCPVKKTTKNKAAIIFNLLLGLARQRRVYMEQDATAPFGTIFIYRSH